MDVVAERLELFDGIRDGRCVERLTVKRLMETFKHPLWNYLTFPISLPYRNVTYIDGWSRGCDCDFIAWYPIRAEDV